MRLMLSVCLSVRLCFHLYAELEEKLSIMSGEAESQEKRANSAEQQGRS